MKGLVLRYMDIKEIIQRTFCESITVHELRDGMVVRIPLSDYLGDSIEAFISVKDNSFTIDDMGHTAGLLFELSQSSENMPGFQLVKRIADTNNIILDFNTGVLKTSGTIDELKTPILSFYKMIIAVQNVLPHLNIRKREVYSHRSLRAKLSRDIVQLKMDIAVQRQIDVTGKYENWPVDYKYFRGENGQKTEVIIITANLARKEPRQKAEHVLSLAHDVLDVKQSRSLRVVYDFDNNEKSEPALRAASLIHHNQKSIGYKSFDYSNRIEKAEISAMTAQDLASYTLIK